jgi:ABC-type transport system substrate-binding protein
MKTKEIIPQLLTIILAATLLSNLPSAASVKGPREDDVVILFYPNIAAAYGALWLRQIDIVAAPITTTEYATAISTINDVLAPVSLFNTRQFDLNNNYTILEYPGIRSPMNYLEMRQAIAFLTDKDYIVNVICGGFAERIDEMIAAPLKGWANESYWFPNYPYEYDPLAAKAVLDSKFPIGTTVNTYYDPSFSGSVPYVREYPADHPNAGTPLAPLVVCYRTDNTARWLAGLMIINHMRMHGIPVAPIPGSAAALYDRVMGDFNYHLYTGGWDVGRFPPLTLYNLYHSYFTYPYGSNYVTGQDTYPELDNLLEDCNYAMSYGEAVTACKRAVGYMTEKCVNIPLWSDRTFYAYDNSVQGVVNMEGSGIINPFTFMNMYKSGGGSIRIGLVGAPNSMNMVYSSWSQDYICLDRMNLYGKIEVPPYNLAADQPGFVKDWETTTWNDGLGDMTLFRQTYRSDAYFCEPVTGNMGRNVNASCYFFNAWYDYQVGTGWFSPSYGDLHHITITGSHSSEVYFSTLSYWNTYYCKGPLRPMDTWSAQPALVTKVTESIIDPATPGSIALSDLPTWFEYVKFNDSPLTLGTDYNIVEGELFVYTTLGIGTLDVRYWAPNDARGFTPGNVVWSTIFEGAGMYYATAFTSGVSLTLKKNPFYYMETPLLGEVDFVRKPNGAYKIDIFDLVYAAGAHLSQGKTVPDSHWFPGADLAPLGGEVDDLDTGTVAGVYWDLEWDPDP